MASFPLLILCLSQILVSLSVTTAQFCYGTGTFTSNSSYGENRNLALSALLINITAHNGFYTTTVGQFPDQVHGLALCRGDYSSETCHKCVNSSNEQLIQGCPNQKEAITWGAADDICIVRFSDTFIFGVMQTRPALFAFNVNNISMNWDKFYEVWNSLMTSLVTKAAMSSSGHKFETGEAEPPTSSTKIYAMVQCTPDLSPNDCENCLKSAVQDYQSYCHGKQGAAILTPSCFLRFELYPFYNSTTEALPPPPPLSPPPPSPSPPPVNPPPTVPTTSKGKGNSSPVLVVIVIVSVAISLTLTAALTCAFARKNRPKVDYVDVDENEDGTNGQEESLRFDFAKIRAATNDFCDANKLGQGGFGPVYRGWLSNGQEIAVKRLVGNCGQGEIEFKNEIVLMARLQHRNLVRLQGFCLEGRERLLIYEFLPNASLDHFIFDPVRRLLLDWGRRYKIIIGIARGILYLHEDCPLRIIHHDLKAGNILLDGEMNPKISDFGMARLFAMDQSKGITKRIVGTFGYMPPEYVKNGQFSVKTDVFSFGVLTLEIISGKKISFHNAGEVEHLLSYAWKNWRKGSAPNLMDPVLRGSSLSEIMKCIHIGLLCVQENVVKRPTIASVVLMLSEESASLPLPSKPGFFVPSGTKKSMLLQESYSVLIESNKSSVQPVHQSVNEASITELNPR